MGTTAKPWRLALIDVDGTLCRGETVIPGAPAFLMRLRERGMAPVFFTNNATRKPEALADMLSSMGMEASPGEVCTAAQATADALARACSPSSVVAYIGVDGLRDALARAGLQPLSVHDDDFVSAAAAAQAAVVGLDQTVNYAQLAAFCNVVFRLRAFTLTNPDARLPVADGFAPGNGAIGALVATTTGILPTVIGKPEAAFVQYALRRYGVTSGEAVLIGDNLATDIAAGRAAGVYTIQVESGVHVEATVAPGAAGLRADEVYPSVAALFL